jgi:putative ABC transport system permease protein
MKFLPYMLKHLRRNWIRTSTTILGMAVCVFLFCVLQTVVQGINWALESVSASRLVTRHAVGLTQQLPATYEPQLKAMPGVKRVAISNWFGGYMGDTPDFKNFFPNMAVQAEDFLAMYPEYELTPEGRSAFMANRRGCIVGIDTAKKFGWKQGTTFQLESSIPPYRIGKPYEFVVEAIYTVDKVKHPGADSSSMYFHYEYLAEMTNHQSGVSIYLVEVADPKQAAAVAKAIDGEYENSTAQTKTETEGAFIAGFINLAGNLVLLLNLIGTAVAFTILFVTANTMSMAVRERRTEIAVLKTLGFSSRLVMFLVLGEALLIGLLGGAVGLLLARAMISILPSLPMIGAALAGFPNVGLSWSVASLGFSFALLLSAAAGFFPALSAFRSRITDMLRTV